MNRLKYLLGMVISLGLLAAAVGFLYKVANRYRYADIVSHIQSLPLSQVFLAILLTVCSYGLLTVYDKLAVNYVGHPLPYRRVGLASFIGYTFSNNLGFALLTGTSVRYRLYTLWGMNPAQIAQVVLFCSVTFFLGLFFVGGLALVFAMPPLPPDLALPDWVRQILDWVGLIAVATGIAYLALPFFWKKPLSFKGISLPVPTFRLSFAQLLVAGLDWVAASAVFYALLPPVDGLSYWNVLTIFMAGNILGVMAHVPGGIGVFESVATFLLAPFLAPPQILGSLIAYRAVYYILPFVLALTAFAGYELLQKLHWLRRVNPDSDHWAHSTMPAILSAASFASGVLLLISCVTPTVPWRLDWLEGVLPLPGLEAVHLGATAVAFGLVICARGLMRHQRRAWAWAWRLLPAGIFLALAKGLDYEEALFMTLAFAALWVAKDDFQRRGSLLTVPYSRAWLVAIAATALASAWLWVLAYRKVWDPELIYRFAYDTDSARALRSAALLVVLSLVFSAYRFWFRWRRRRGSMQARPA
ncbi:MAG: lysylphosphatidylglycerol synthetase family protein [Gammaproteobacteria bacterium]|nr:lysylphosphatidylglycerol synthetase family protein [Gammaproteobacteria bacterium]